MDENTLAILIIMLGIGSLTTLITMFMVLLTIESVVKNK